MKRAAFAAALAVASCGASAPPPRPAVRLANLEMFELRPGANPIPNLAGDGRDGLIVSGWRDNGNAHGFNVFMVLVRGESGDYGVVTFASDQDAVTIADAPHTSEDYVRSVRFGRGMLNGRRETLAFVATRHWRTSIPEPAPTIVQVLALRHREESIGPADFFAEQARFTTSRPYCNAETALGAELGVPPRPEAVGPDTRDGC